MLKLTEIKVSSPLKSQLHEAEKNAAKHKLSAQEILIYNYGILVMALGNATGENRYALEAALSQHEKEITISAKTDPYYMTALINITNQFSSTLKKSLIAFTKWINKADTLKKNLKGSP